MTALRACGALIVALFCASLAAAQHSPPPSLKAASSEPVGPEPLSGLQQAPGLDWQSRTGPTPWLMEVAVTTGGTPAWKTDERTLFYAIDWAQDPGKRIPMTTEEGVTFSVVVESIAPEVKPDTLSNNSTANSTRSVRDSDSDSSVVAGRPTCSVTACLSYNAPIGASLYREKSVTYSWGLHCNWAVQSVNEGEPSHTSTERRVIRSGPAYLSLAVSYTPAQGVAYDADWGSCAIKVTLAANACAGAGGSSSPDDPGMGGKDCGLAPLAPEQWPTKAAPYVVSTNGSLLLEYFPAMDYRMPDVKRAAGGTGLANRGTADEGAEWGAGLGSVGDSVLALTVMRVRFNPLPPDSWTSSDENAAGGGGAASSSKKKGKGKRVGEILAQVYGYAMEGVVPVSSNHAAAAAYDLYNLTVANDDHDDDDYSLYMVYKVPRFSLIYDDIPPPQRSEQGISSSEDEEGGITINGRLIATGDIDSNVEGGAAAQLRRTPRASLPPQRAFPIYYLIENRGPSNVEVTGVEFLSPACLWGRSGGDCAEPFASLDPHIVNWVPYNTDLPTVKTGVMKPTDGQRKLSDPAPISDFPPAPAPPSRAGGAKGPNGAQKHMYSGRTLLSNPLYRFRAHSHVRNAGSAEGRMRVLTDDEAATVDPSDVIDLAALPAAHSRPAHSRSARGRDVTPRPRFPSPSLSSSMPTAPSVSSIGAARSDGLFSPELYLRLGNTPVVPGAIGSLGVWDARLIGSAETARFLLAPLPEVTPTDMQQQEHESSVTALWYYAIRMSGTGEAALWSYDPCPHMCAGHGSCGTGPDPHACTCEPFFNDEIDCSVGPPSPPPKGFNPFTPWFLATLTGGAILLLVVIRLLVARCCGRGRGRKSRRRAAAAAAAAAAGSDGHGGGGGRSSRRGGGGVGNGSDGGYLASDGMGGGYAYGSAEGYERTLSALDSHDRPHGSHSHGRQSKKQSKHHQQQQQQAQQQFQQDSSAYAGSDVGHLYGSDDAPSAAYAPPQPSAAMPTPTSAPVPAPAQPQIEAGYYTNIAALPAYGSYGGHAHGHSLGHGVPHGHGHGQGLGHGDSFALGEGGYDPYINDGGSSFGASGFGGVYDHHGSFGHVDAGHGDMALRSPIGSPGAKKTKKSKGKMYYAQVHQQGARASNGNT